MEDIFVVVPTLNPNIEIFKKFLDNLLENTKNVLVYDDGCNKEYDSFFKDLEKKKITVLHHYVNLGKGRSMKDAFNYLLLKYPKLKGVVTADSDGQHSIKDIEKVSNEILKHPDSLILGCRDFDSENVPTRNKFGNKITRGVFKTFVGLSITDTQTGLRGYPTKVMSSLMTVKGDRFEYETNMLIETMNKKIPIIEVPIETIYLENSNSESHFNPVKDSFEIYKLFFKFILAGLSSFILDYLLFYIFSLIIGGTNSILYSTICARVLSSMYNFLVNSNVVFKNRNSSSLIKYACLCIIQMFVSGLAVEYIVKLTHISSMVIKLIVDIVLFVVNFVIQRTFIFVGEKHEK